MKVTVVAADEGRYVLQPHLDKLLPALQRRGYSVEFLGWDRQSRRPQQAEHDGVLHTMLLRGGGYSSRRLLLWMPLWYLVASLKLTFRAAHDDEVLMAIDFEGAAPSAVAARLRGGRFIYNCRDNVAMRYDLPRPVKRVVCFLDRLVMAYAESVIFPDESRIPVPPPRRAVVVRNCAPDIAITSRPDPSRLTVYAMGNLREDRGVGLLLDAAAEIDGCRVIAAGKCRDVRLAARLAMSPLVDYRGVLTPAQALAACGEADVVMSFYRPGSEINRKAISNKWSDAMMAARPILINSEVEKAAWVTEQEIGYACAYRRNDLVRTLRHIAANRKEAAARGMRGRQLWEYGYRWDVAEERLIALIEEAVGRARRAPRSTRRAVATRALRRRRR
jgi:glycosyltransferase involved in cell wall biosynthesis